MPDTTDVTIPFLSRTEVEHRAREVLKRHNLTTIPINPLVLANREGIQVNNATFTDDNLAGMIVKRGGDVAILVNQDDPPFRKRFTIAHELAHYYLHLTQDGEYVDKEANLFRQETGFERDMTASRRQEIQANMFAASLLMPEIEVRKYWEERRSIKELAKIFNVSVTAMGHRIESLGLE
jgi:Zn-dependent peptidase ImmA (M78 family)